MSPEETFLTDICEHPEDDAPRLVYADWLDEHDQTERARFIRVQCALARLPQDDPARPEREAAEEALLLEHGEVWLGPLGEFVSEPTFHRGFVEAGCVAARHLISHGERIFRLVPLRHLRLALGKTRDNAARVAACPYLARLRGLELDPLWGSEVGDKELAELLRSPHLVNLEELRLRETRADKRALAALRTGAMTRLKVLDLCHNNFRTALRELTAGPPPFRLEVLNLAINGLNATMMRVLADWPGLARVRDLSLGGNFIGAAGARALAASTFLGALRTLDVHGCGLKAAGMRALAGAPTLAGLSTLHLESNGIGRAGLEALLASPHLDGLRGLHLSRNNLGDQGAELLAGWPGLARHTALDLGGNDIGPAGVEALCRSPHLGELTWLELFDNPVSDSGVRALAGCPRLSGLIALGLGACRVGPAGARALLDSPHLSGLTRVNLWNNPALTAPVREALTARFGDVGT
jgi:uncharacterized protein (TIGR02996 family)